MAADSKLSHYIPAFDGIRAIAILAVLLTHTSYGYFNGGFLGVDLFFALSGYLITGLLLKEYNASGTIRLDLFYWRRVYRLAPPILIAIALTSFLGLFVPEDSYPPRQIALTLAILFFANLIGWSLGPLAGTWSLALEEQFYLFWPKTFLFLLQKRGGKFLYPVIIGIILFSGTLRIVMFACGYDKIFLYGYTFARLDSLLMGGLAVLIAEMPWVRTAVGLFCCGKGPELLMMVFLFMLGLSSNRDSFLYWGGFTIIADVSSLFLLGIVHSPKRTVLLMILESFPFRWLGRRSYGVYLYHPPIVLALEHFRVRHSFSNLCLITALRFALPMAVAAVSYHFVELPCLRRKSFLQWTPAASVVDREGLEEKGPSAGESLRPLSS